MRLRPSTERRSCGAGYASPMPPVDGLRSPESDSGHAAASAIRGPPSSSTWRPAGSASPSWIARRFATLLATPPRIAIVGASPSPVRPSHGVLLDLHGARLSTSCRSIRPPTRSPGSAATRRCGRPSTRPGRSTSSTCSGSRRRARRTPARRSRSGPAASGSSSGSPAARRPDRARGRARGRHEPVPRDRGGASTVDAAP